MANLNFKSEVAIKDICNIDEGFKLSQRFQYRMENKHILACLDEKYHCHQGLYQLEYSLYHGYYHMTEYFGLYIKRPWISQGGQITHIKEKNGIVYVIMQKRQVVCLKHGKAWYIPLFTLQHTFETDGPATCLAHYQNGVIVCIKFPQEFASATSTPQLHIYDCTGKLQYPIVYNNGKPIFNDPQDIAVDGFTIIVSDQGDKSVIFLSETGNVFHTFKHEQMSSPRGLCIDQFSNIYIATGGKIIQLTEDYSASRVIISSPKQKMSFLHFCEETNLLSAAYDGTGKIANYQFLQNNQVTTRNREAHKRSLKDDPTYLLFAGLALVYLYVVLRLPRT